MRHIHSQPKQEPSMSATKKPVAVALLCVALGFGLANLVHSPQASAQVGAPVSPARFQISAFDGNGNDATSHGAYAIDTMTGIVWVLLPNQAPKRVNQILP
jgi:hypothetical protein